MRVSENRRCLATDKGGPLCRLADMAEDLLYHISYAEAAQDRSLA